VDEDLARIPKAEALFGTATYAAAVPKLLAAGSLTGAMWAARLTAALEKAIPADELTDEVLRHPGTQEAFTRFRHDASEWPTAMGAQAFAEARNSLAGATARESTEGGAKG
jgi:hypothetical protein